MRANYVLEWVFLAYILKNDKVQERYISYSF